MSVLAGTDRVYWPLPSVAVEASTAWPALPTASMVTPRAGRRRHRAKSSPVPADVPNGTLSKVALPVSVHGRAVGAGADGVALVGRSRVRTAAPAATAGQAQQADAPASLAPSAATRGKTRATTPS